MQVPTFDELAAFVREQTAFRGPLTEATALQGDIGVYADDLWELVDAFATRFGVDIAGFRWYFHSPEEGFNFGGLLFTPPNKRVREVPITLGILLESARRGAWAVEYPEHQPPISRPDIWVNQLLVLGFVGLALVWVVRGCLR